jgi:hypothetical protein
VCVYPTEQAKAGLGRRITMMIFLLESVMWIPVGKYVDYLMTQEDA